MQPRTAPPSCLRDKLQKTDMAAKPFSRHVCVRTHKSHIARLRERVPITSDRQRYLVYDHFLFCRRMGGQGRDIDPVGTLGGLFRGQHFGLAAFYDMLLIAHCVCRIGSKNLCSCSGRSLRTGRAAASPASAITWGTMMRSQVATPRRRYGDLLAHAK